MGEKKMKQETTKMRLPTNILCAAFLPERPLSVL